MQNKLRARATTIAITLLGMICLATAWTTRARAAPTEIKVVDLKTGDGPEPQRGWFATIRYTGWIYDELASDRKGKQFIHSDDRGAPVSFVYGYKRALPGLETGMQGMKTGGRRSLIIPHAFRGARRQANSMPANE